MLLELECDRFICSGVPRGIISFKKGLNAVTGGYSISNSIGKTTFLKVIDFVFGGNDYCSMASVIGEHEIKFAFKFDKTFRFIRKVHTPDCVIKCKEDSYEPDYEISLEDFRKFLLEKYKLEDIGLTFNNIVNPYVRFTKKKCDTENLLTDFSKECKFKEGVVLEKLFLRYDEVNPSFKEYVKIGYGYKLRYVAFIYGERSVCSCNHCERTIVLNLKTLSNLQCYAVHEVPVFYFKQTGTFISIADFLPKTVSNFFQIGYTITLVSYTI